MAIPMDMLKNVDEVVGEYTSSGIDMLSAETSKVPFTDSAVGTDGVVVTDGRFDRRSNVNSIFQRI